MEGGIRKSYSLSRLGEIGAVLDTDEKSSFTFSKAGTYPYFCSIHPKMTGSVVVQ